MAGSAKIQVLSSFHLEVFSKLESLIEVGFYVGAATNNARYFYSGFRIP